MEFRENTGPKPKFSERNSRYIFVSVSGFGNRTVSVTTGTTETVTETGNFGQNRKFRSIIGKNGPNTYMSKWSKHKKSIISAPGLVRAILSVFSDHDALPTRGNHSNRPDDQPESKIPVHYRLKWAKYIHVQVVKTQKVNYLSPWAS